MDFSSIPSLETILGYSVGGVTVSAILIAIYKIIKWLKHNPIEKAVKLVTDAIVGKDINVDLTVIAEKKLNEIHNSLLSIIVKQKEEMQAQAVVMADMADIIANSKLASDSQKKALQTHTEAIRVYEAAKPKEIIKVKLEPINTTENVQKVYIPEAL